jgi:hypothetical protein
MTVLIFYRFPSFIGSTPQKHDRYSRWEQPTPSDDEVED